MGLRKALDTRSGVEEATGTRSLDEVGVSWGEE